MGDDGPLIGVDELERRLGRGGDDVVVLDASWIYPPFNAAGIDVRARYAAAHVPGSRFLDLEAFTDPGGRPDPRVPAVAPPAPGPLRAALAAAGTGDTGTIVVTDMDGGCTTAPLARLALLRAGYRRVRLLDGGTPAWAALSRAGLTAADPRFVGPAPGVRAGREAVPGAPADAGGSAQMIDCRALPGNEGVLPPDYAGLALPADARVPSGTVVEEGPGGGLRFRRPGALRRLLREAGVEPARPKVAWCYFGPGAATVAAAIEAAGWGAVRVDAASLVGRAVAGGLVRPPGAAQAGEDGGAAPSW